ncbi:hypothetical protein ACFRAR_12175 [Kitasatospora sp. NPDC056651]|uniref:hypothetical protein n=1 Tax=Kitasatospora sp. NPDC056651 TaxID=3345892 RepID=UPI0036BE9393
MTELPQHQVSPEATGGAGTIEEYTLGAVALTRLLTGDLFPGLLGAPTSIGLQRRVAGNTLDDLVVRSRSDSGEVGIDFQIKRKASPTKSDGAFTDALTQCLEVMEKQPEALASGLLHMGFGASEPRGPLTQLKRLAQLARAHSTHETFLGVMVPGAIDESVRARFDHVRGAVAQESAARGVTVQGGDLDELTYRFLKYLRVWIFEVDSEGRDVLEATSRLATLLPAGGPSAYQVFAILRTMAEEWGPSAGVIDAPMVRAALLARGIPLTADPRHKGELGRVLDASRQELARTANQMGGTLRLERKTAAQTLAGAINDGGIVLVSGAAGVGKSVLVRRMVQGLDDEATVVVISLTTRSGDTLATIQQELGISHLGTVLAAAPTTGLRMMFIDGAEHALTDAGRLLESLLEAAPTNGASSPPWTVVITCRADATGPLTQRLGGRLRAHVELDELSDPEVDEVSGAFPALAPLTRHPRGKRLLRRPYLVDLMVRSQAAPGEGEALGEEDIIAVMHEKVVRRSEGLLPGQGTAHDRDVAWNALAEAVIAGSGSSRLTGVDGTAVGGLVSDDVFRRQRSTYRFAHDVLADYATAMRLGDEDGGELLAAATAPRSLIRAVRLALQRNLAEAAGDAGVVRQVWAHAQNLCRDLSARDGSRWEDVPFEALISMGSPDGVLAVLTMDLLANDGAGLARLIDVTGRYATTSRYEPDGTGLEIDDVLAAPVVTLLSRLSDHLPGRLTIVATQLIRRWLVSVEINGHRASTFIPDPAVLSIAVATWAAEDSYGDRHEWALAVVGLLGGHLSAEGRALLERARGHDLDVVAEDPEVLAVLARDNPDLLLQVAGSYYLDLPLTLDPNVPGRRPPRPSRDPGRRRTELSGYEGEDGVRDHSHRTSRRLGFGLAGPGRGPFAALLNRSPKHGLRLVGAVVDAATDARLRVEESFDWPPRPVRSPLRLPHWEGAVTYSGPATAWGWYQGSGNGAYPAISALMALRAWAKEQFATRPLEDVLDEVLGAGKSVAFPAVAYSLLIPDVAAAGPILDGFLELPEVWDLEIGRTAGGQGLFHRFEDQEALRQGPDRVAMQLVLAGTAERRQALKAVAERLLTASREALGNPPSDDPALSVPRRRALFLDIEAYRGTPSVERPGVIEVSVDVPADVQQQLEHRGGRAAMLSLALTNAVHAAMKIRDGEATEARAAQLYTQVQDLQRSIAATPGARSVHTVDDVQAIVAAAVVAQAALGEQDARQVLPEATRILMEIGIETRPEPYSYGSGRDTLWDVGADRSAAIALPVILIHGDLLAAGGASRADVITALERLAGSESREVRERLTSGLAAVWTTGCDDSDPRQAHHAAAMTVYREWLSAAGLGPWNGQERPQVRLSEPLATALEQPGVLFDLSTAADALPGLKAAAACDCKHGDGARTTLMVLMEHDVRAWPTEWARRHHGSGAWRREMDAWAAAEVLAGDDAMLGRYLGGFAAVPEQLTGLLAAMAERAISPEQSQRLFTVWSTVLDRLLPGARQAEDPGAERLSWRDEAGLDKALLPERPEAAKWPLKLWVQGLVRWMDAFAPSPSLCDRLIECLSRFSHAISPEGVGLVLRMLGDDTGRILRDSRYVTIWLRVVLLERPEGLEAHRQALRMLLDDLAAKGSTDAIQIQRELEA